MKTRPPSWAYRTLATSLPPGSAADSVLGDLQEEYARRRPGLFRDLWYIVVALRLAAGYRLAGWGRAQRTGSAGSAWAGWAQDTRHAARGLWRNPGYLFTAVLTLTVGIGASTAAFSILYGSLIQPLPYRDPGSLLRIYGWRKEFSTESHNSMSPTNFRDLREQARGLEGMAGYQHWWFNLSAGADEPAAVPLRAPGLRAEPALLSLLGTVPQRGRLLSEADMAPGAAPVVMIDHDLWRSRFAADPEIVGKKIRVDLVDRTVVGVLPAAFAFLRQPQIIVPLDLAGPDYPRRRMRAIDGIARLAPGVTPEAGLAELQAIYAELEQQYPEDNDGWSVTGVLEQEWRVRGGRRQLWLFAGAVLIVLLISCVNVAALMLVRAEARQHELGVRAALGAGRLRLARLFVAESLVVSLAGGLLGALLSRWLVDLALVAYAASIPRSDEVGVDARALAFAIGVAVLSGLLVALAPALQLPRARPHEALRRGGRTSAGQTAPLRKTLVIVEVALAVILVTGAALMIDTTWRLHRVELGVDRDRVLTFGIGLPTARYGTEQEITAFWDRFVLEVGAVGGIEAVGLSSRQPLNGGTNGTVVLGSEPAGEPTADMLVEIRSISPDYLRTAGLRLLRGRWLTTTDRVAGGGVLVNEAFVRERLGGRDPLRETIRPTWLRQAWPIVGVVSDTRDFGPTEDPRPTAYWIVGSEQLGMVNAYMYATLRAAGEPLAMLPAIRERLAAIDTDLPLLDVLTLEEIAGRSVGGNRQSALSLLSIFATVALMLGAIGIYGVVSYGVDTRAREIGVRMALGATQGAVVRLFLRQGIRMALFGVMSGLLISALAGRLLASMLYEVTPTDPRILATVALILAAAATLASWLPARRAARLPIVTTLRGN